MSDYKPRIADALLKRKLFEADGPYHKIWLALQADNELTAIVRSRQLHIYPVL